jgi:hypothetical protein
MKRYFLILSLFVGGCSPSKLKEFHDEVVYVKPMPMKVVVNIISSSDSDNLITFQGKISDSTTSENIPGTRVEFAGPEKRIFANIDGVFRLDSLQRKDTLMLYSIGYLSKKISIQDVIKGKTVW